MVTASLITSTLTNTHLSVAAAAGRTDGPVGQHYLDDEVGILQSTSSGTGRVSEGKHPRRPDKDPMRIRSIH
jgi:hypothetical protein